MHGLEYSLLVLSEIAPKMDEATLVQTLRELAGASHEYDPTKAPDQELAEKIKALAIAVDPNFKP